ncbi:hypothetical protein B0H15DRAFT_833419 [Mycena belliarum]|uniref:Ubiquitin-like domain-containing protein n=1 Tax=Mycena belliarum TaxID=1033014 RepID=A0AAD6U9C8_9AGAR|nr:hypothetical protein B0H15DRAFT_833419 [Mycena belliae]
MPKVKPTTVTRSSKQTLFVLTDGKKRVLIPRPKTHKAAMDAVQVHFPQTGHNTSKLQTDQLEICDGEMTDITPESWETVIELVSSVFVARAHECHAPTSIGDTLVDSWAMDDRGTAISLKFQLEQASVTVRMKTDTKIVRALPAIARRFGIEEEDCKMLYKGTRVHGDHTPLSLELEDGDIVPIYRDQVGGKPVIYVFSPEAINASLILTLTPEWSLSAVYPVVPQKSLPSGVGERIQWDVRTHADGSLTEMNTGLDVAYLFWEAHTNLDVPISPPISPITTQAAASQTFSPLACTLTPTDSVLLAVGDITPYLDKILIALGLHTEARTSFITYWLPSFLKHTHVALRFVPQAAYERAAALEITPAPAIVTRVFMLFRGIADEERGLWSDAKPAADDVNRWAGVVGVDIDRALDVSLFRVLEWGGMEVLGAPVSA